MRPFTIVPPRRGAKEKKMIYSTERGETESEMSDLEGRARVFCAI